MNILLFRTASEKKTDRAHGFQIDVTARLIRQLSLTDRQTSINNEDEEFEKWGYFGMLAVRTHYVMSCMHANLHVYCTMLAVLKQVVHKL